MAAELDLSLVRLLSDGCFHSGEELGKSLSLSRTGVWKRLQRLAEHGLAVERVRGKGYRLPGGLDLLEEGAIRAAAGGGFHYLLSIHGALDSTSSQALTLCREGRRPPFAVLAEYQSAGRGRRGREWVSPLGRNLFLSVAAAFDGGATQLEGLSLAVGVVVAETLASHGLGGRIGLKWPNDVYVAGRKLGGILIELSGDLDMDCIAIIGIGVNGLLPVDQVSAIEQPWTDYFSETGQQLDRNVFAGELLAALDKMFSRFREQGFSAFAERWANLDVCRGRQVRVQGAGHQVFGKALGVTEHGGLRVLTEQGEEVFHGGEVSLRVE